MQEIQERPQAGDGEQRGRGAEPHQGGQASKPLDFQASNCPCTRRHVCDVPMSTTNRRCRRFRRYRSARKRATGEPIAKRKDARVGANRFGLHRSLCGFAADRDRRPPFRALGLFIKERRRERHQAFQSANQLISQASKPLNFQASGVRGGGVGGGGGWG